jgi:hypothetical protein
MLQQKRQDQTRQDQPSLERIEAKVDRIEKVLDGISE